MKTIKKDVVVLGAGLAGLYTALHIDACHEVAVISKESVEKSNSFLAQGGIATCINADDSFLEHVQDTFIAGANINDFDAVALLVKQAPGEIHRLIELGVEFDKDDQGMILTTLEGGHSHRRVLHAHGDATGKMIMEIVAIQAKHQKNIEILEKSMAIRIVQEPHGRIMGVLVLKNDRQVFIQTRKVVIATGGVGALYEGTTNQSSSTGDGIALASEVGCALVNMCFIQFHPTAYYFPSGQQRFLISEAVRGEGGILRNHLHHAFMIDYDKRGDLAPRDIVARSIEKETRLHGVDHVWLDITHKDKEYLMQRFPSIYHFLAQQNIYMEKDYIPVAPVAHYFVGGIMANLNGETNVKGIYACGEVSSTGVHGANRLASNSLLECIVFGKRVALHINESLKQEDAHPIIDPVFDQTNNDQSGEKSDHTIKDSIRKIMSTHVGIVRTQANLEEARRQISDIHHTLKKKRTMGQSYYELMNMCQVSILIIDDAIEQTSIGCHYKEQSYEEAMV